MNSATCTIYYKPLKLFSTGIIEKAENLFFYKKINFIFENEYRFIIKKNNVNNKFDFLNINIGDLLYFIDEILIRPEQHSYCTKINSLYKYYLSQGFVYEKYPYNIDIDNKSFCRISQLYGNHSHEI